MKPEKLIYKILFVSLMLVVGCGQVTEKTTSSQTEASSVGDEINHYASSNRGSGVQSQNAKTNITKAIEAFLDTQYGQNETVSKVVLGTAGAYPTEPIGVDYPTFAQSSIFERDASNLFKLVSGNPAQTASIPASVVNWFLGYGIIPLVAGGASFCAGQPGITVESGVAVLGLAYNIASKKAEYYAGTAVRNGSTYQACDLSGCTGVVAIPSRIANMFPVCNNIL